MAIGSEQEVVVASALVVEASVAIALTELEHSTKTYRQQRQVSPSSYRCLRY